MLIQVTSHKTQDKIIRLMLHKVSTLRFCDNRNQLIE